MVYGALMVLLLGSITKIYNLIGLLASALVLPFLIKLFRLAMSYLDRANGNVGLAEFNWSITNVFA